MATSVQTNSTAVTRSAPPPAPHDSSATAPVGPGEERAQTAPAHGEEPSPHGAPPGDGNARGSAKAGGSSNGNGNAFGNGNANGNANTNGNGNAYGKAKASGTPSADVPLGVSLVPATPSS
jgi:hypothetical protein